VINDLRKLVVAKTLIVIRKREVMDRFTTAIRQSVENKNWYAALYLSLTLPDICARLESDNGKTNRAKFVAWFDQT
jgi:hypothetical protein